MEEFNAYLEFQVVEVIKGSSFIMIKLTIIEDNVPLARQLRNELLEFPDFEKIELADSGTNYVSDLKKKPGNVPDCVLMDISMKEVDEGITTCRLLKERFPSVKVIMFTIVDDDDFVFEAFKAGAVGYLLKNERPLFIYKTIKDVMHGAALMSPGIALKTIRLLTGENPKKGNSASAELETLSVRELEVLKLTAKGMTYQAIGDKLFISVETVKKHIVNIFHKLHVNNKISAVNKLNGLS